VVLLTGADDPRSRFWARSAGATAYVGKEAMRHLLVPEVKRALGSKPEEPRRPAPSTPPQSAMNRLSRVLDDLLFDAVLASEVRRLVNAPDRKAFAHSITVLASDVVTYAYMLVRLEGPKSPTYVVHAREAWPSEEDEALRAFGIPLDSDVETIATGPTGAGVEVIPGEPTSFPIRTGNEELGEIRVYSGARPLAAGDATTIALLAREIGTVAKAQFLMEHTKLLALTDALTTLYNRRHTNTTLELEVARTNRYGTPLSLVMCDVDHFKSINDRFGHNVGDEVIRRVANVFPVNIRRIDVAGRWGGEEFVILLPNTPLPGATLVGERLRAAIEGLGPIAGGPERVTVSVGVAEHTRGGTATELVERADQALYSAKQRGRNRVEQSAEANGHKSELGSDHAATGG
jgi:diguanylate cyclase (GGDEF)-like protein